MNSIHPTGAPGAEPRWTHSAKDGIGTAYHTGCRLWFTLSHGIVNEIYCPTVDTPNTRDFQFLISDGESFVHEEKRDLLHKIELPERGCLFYRLTNSEPGGRYRIIKHLLAGPYHSGLLVHTRVEIADESLRGKLRLYALLAPHLGGHGADNCGYSCDTGERTLLRAEREGAHLVLGCDRGFSRRSVGYVGTSDGWQDLMKGNFRMDWEYPEAGPGNIALTGEIDLTGDPDGGHAAEFLLGVTFGDSPVSGAAKMLQSFATPFATWRERYVTQWRRGDREEDDDFAQHTGDGGGMWRLSRCVLLAHEDKNFQGAIIASLSTPWGETKGDDDVGGYHLVWTRDLVQSAIALLSTGQTATPLRALLWLTCIQQDDGSFPQNSWIDGTPYWRGIQLDEMAAPLLLAWQLRRTAPEAYERAFLRPVLAAAAGYLMAAGPATAQDRWEENAGYSPSTLATIIAALVAGSEMERAAGHESSADFALQYADWLNAHLEEWCVTHAGSLMPGRPRHYVRITPTDPMLPDPHPRVDELEIQIANGGGRHPARDVVGGDFLQLVRYGLRPADDAVILASVEVIDHMLKRELPGGPCWRRYNHDGYGQKPDGNAFDGTGEGRCWPIMTGERGHYELAAGRDAAPYLQALENFANAGGMIAEQLWDTADLPDGKMKLGHPTGSAMPLCWSHAEYLTLARSIKDGRVFDRIEPVYQRYVVEGKRDCSHEIWTFRHRTRQVPSGRTLRILTSTPARVRWTVDGWRSEGEAETTCVDVASLHSVDLPTVEMAAGSFVEWTFFWPGQERWEGKNYKVEITPPTG